MVINVPDKGINNVDSTGGHEYEYMEGVGGQGEYKFGISYLIVL